MNLTAFFTSHLFWAQLTLAVLVWYSTVTIYVGIRGAFDIKHMLTNLRLDHSGVRQSDTRHEESDYLELGTHSKIVAWLSTALGVMGLFTVIMAEVGFPKDSPADMAVNRVFMIGGTYMYFTYAVFGFVAAARRKMPNTGLIGFMFFGVFPVRSPKDVTYRFVLAMFLASMVAWFFPLALWLL
jgi:hypothetical protein